MKNFCVLVVDDEPRIVKFLQVRLKVSGYRVLTAANGAEALELAREDKPDLVVLDVMMPGMDGLETLRQLREESPVPVIILSAKEGSSDKVKGLQQGADDYMAKPFSPDELVARIESIKRRLVPQQERTSEDAVRIGTITVDANRHVVVVNGVPKQLTRIEWLLLNEFAHNAGKLVLYTDLLTKIWGPEYRDDIQILRTWVSRLRKKIERDPNHPTILKTVPKTGYMIAEAL